VPRIAFISSTFPDYQGCGTGIYAGYLTAALAQQGHEVHVITSARPEIRATYGKVTVHKVMEHWGLTEIPKLMQVFFQIKPDLIHINHPTAIAGAKTSLLVNLLPEVNRHLWKLPVITTLHEFHNVSVLGKIKVMPLLFASDVITVTNRRYQERVTKYLPAGMWPKVEVVNIGSQFRSDLPIADKNEQRAKWNLAPDDLVFGFAGFITPPKGFHNLIEAVAPLIKDNPKIKVLALSSWNLSSASYRQKILDMIESAGIVSNVIFTGYLKDEDMWAGLSAVDVCVFPFDFPVEERSSGPLRQVLHRGMPVIVFAEDLGYSEFGLKHGENIWFSPHQDIGRLRQDMLKMINDRALKEKLSSGAKDLKDEFSFDAVSNSMSRLYSQLLSKPQRNLN
jgi:glycosyltransferase involved in cell wall biosynthesis